MIRVYKHKEAPASLASQTQYDGEDVKRQLLVDQHRKCYLCERILVTDFEVEHLQSQKDNEHLKYDWNNLFLSCSYCNRKKSNLFSLMYSPSLNNVEDEVIHKIHFASKVVEFSVTATKPDIDKLAVLLTRIYNGSGIGRKIKEELFFEDFISKMSAFQSLLFEYKLDQTEKLKLAIEQELSIEKELLAFKLQMLRESGLLEDFKAHVVWNK